MPHQPYHMVDQSPWPILTSINSLSLILSLLILIKTSMTLPLTMSFLCLTMCMFQWWRDVIRESTFQGSHTSQVMMNLKMGMLLFILSEIMFFISFFWAFFHSSLSPSIQIGSLWPPQGITPFNPTLTPLLNTTILLVSGISITWAHHSLLNSNYTHCSNALQMTYKLGMYFLVLQMWEYSQAPFTISDSIYGSTFFLSTGFHGLHVLVGSLFLLTTSMRLSLLQFSSHHHFGFEAAAWYWHFVDVVWLFLYIMIYWWSN